MHAPHNRSLRLMDTSQISREILAYLVEHPEAQDTIEGILEWWLLERQMRIQATRVETALFELVAEGFLLEHKRMNSRTHYRINQSKYKEIQMLLTKNVG